MAAQFRIYLYVPREARLLTPAGDPVASPACVTCLKRSRGYRLLNLVLARATAEESAT